MTKTGSILLISSLLIGVIFCPIFVHEWKALSEETNYKLEETHSVKEESNSMLQGNDEVSEELSSMIQENDEVSEELSSMTQERDEMPDEFYTFKGKWKVGKYIDCFKESTGVDIESEEYEESKARYEAKYKEKYEGYIFEISEDSIVYFGASNELGYYYDDYAKLFIVFRQPSNIEIVPPFLCASIQLKESDEWFDIIIDGNGKAIFVVGHLFFELDRVNEKENETVYNRVLEDGETFLDGYHNLILEKDIKRAALICLDEDDIPELLVLKSGEYRLYSCDGTQIMAIAMPDAGIKANAYGPKHDFENYSKEFIFYWFEYVPYKGLVRIHSGDDEERCDYYLKYEDGSFVLELEANSVDYTWHTYDAKQEIDNEEFLSRLSDLGYDKLIPCGYLYENIADAYENLDRTSNAGEVLDDFINGNIDALYSVEEINDIPEESFVMRSYEDCYEYITAGEEWWGKLEYVDFDNDGEEELIIHGYTGARAFFDVIGDMVYEVIETTSSTDFASVAEMKGKRVIERADYLYVGRKCYEIMQYDACGCLVDFFGLYAFYEESSYSAGDEFEYRGQKITMEEFEEIENSIKEIPSE